MAPYLFDLDDAGHVAIALAFREDHFFLLAAQRAAQNGRVAPFQHGFVYIELVGVDLALHDHLAQAVNGGDENHVAEAGLGVEGEHHAAFGLVAAHHFLHAGGKRHLTVIETVMHPVGDGAVVEQRGIHGANGSQQVVLAANVEKGFLLAGEGGLGQILGGGRGAYGEGNIVAVFRL